MKYSRQRSRRGNRLRRPPNRSAKTKPLPRFPKLSKTNLLGGRVRRPHVYIAPGPTVLPFATLARSRLRLLPREERIHFLLGPLLGVAIPLLNEANELLGVPIDL